MNDNIAATLGFIYLTLFITINIISWMEAWDNKTKYRACLFSLTSPIWFIALPIYFVRYTINLKKEINKEELKKNPQIYLCPECERKFLEE